MQRRPSPTSLLVELGKKEKEFNHFGALTAEEIRKSAGQHACIGHGRIVAEGSDIDVRMLPSRGSLSRLIRW